MKKRTHINKRRVGKGLSMLAFAERIGITEPRGYAIERGRYRPKPAEAAAWAFALDMKPEEAFPDIFPPAPAAEVAP